METTTTQQTLPSITIETAKAKLRLALNQNRFQKLQTEADSLVYNEDNVLVVKDFLANFKKLYKTLEVEFKAIKKPFKEGADTCDAANREMIALLDGIFNKVQGNYTKLAKEIQEKQAAIAREKERIEKIKNGIGSNLLSFSQRIANASTLEDVLAVERIINLEKGQKAKYAEFIEEAVLKFESLTDAIKQQKEKIRMLLKLQEEKEAAEKSGDDEKFLEITEKEESLVQAIEEAKEEVQADAISVVSNPDAVEIVHPILPTVKARYSKWEYEVLDMDAYKKKLPEFLTVAVNEEYLDNILKTLKSSGVLKGKKEYLGMKGVRFYLEETF